MRKWIRCLCALVMVCCIGYLVYDGVITKRREEFYRTLMETDSENTNAAQDSARGNKAGLLESLKRKNPECVAVVTIPGTTVNYPVMQTDREGGSYYLRRNFKEEHETGGTPFLDVRCSLERPDDNLIVYGHNMRNMTMFGTLKKYAEKDFYEEHPIFYLDYGQENKAYEICAVLKLDLGTQEDIWFYEQLRWDEDGKEEEFVKYITQRSLYSAKARPQPGDRFVTLSTCSYHADAGRLAVVGRQRTDEDMNNKTELEK